LKESHYSLKNWLVQAMNKILCFKNILKWLYDFARWF